MSDCELIKRCTFLEALGDMPGMSGIYRDQYCREAHHLCARYQVFKAVGRNVAPPDLYPNQTRRVNEIVANV